ISRINATNNKSFYKLYYSKVVSDTSGDGGNHFQKPTLFCKELKSKRNDGPICFYAGYTKMAYVTNSNLGKQNVKNEMLKLYFAEKKDGRWSMTSSFPFN